MDTLSVAVFSSFVAIAAAVYYVGNGITRARNLTAERLAQYGRKISRQEEAIREREMKRPFADRALAPMFERFGSPGESVHADRLDRTDREAPHHCR